MVNRVSKIAKILTKKQLLKARNIFNQYLPTFSLCNNKTFPKKSRNIFKIKKLKFLLERKKMAELINF
jgi:hypothetical protein